MLTTIATRDGKCPTHVFRPSGEGRPWPAVIMYMDGVGIRPAMTEIAERLATHGYFVVLPDLYYRHGPYEPMDASAIFTNPEKVKWLRETFFPYASPDKAMSDTATFLAWLDAQPDVKPDGIATLGYCMGGMLSMMAAGTFPESIVAAAAFHAGRLATDVPDSPHRLASKMRARVYVAGATDDMFFPDDMKARFDEALTKAGVDHVIETYPARHGWVLRDTPTHDAACTERHWEALLAFLAPLA